MWGLRSSRTVAIGASLAVLIVCSVLPLAYMLRVSLTGPPGSGSAYAALLLDPRQLALLCTTAGLGAGTAVLATLVGVPLGVGLARIELRRKPLVRVLLAAPMLLPPYVVALAWIAVAGRAGGSSEWIYSATGAAVVLALVLYPFPMLATEAAVRRIEPCLEEAASIVAPPGRVLRRITLRLAAPAIAASALVVFVLAVSEFGVPGLLRVRVFTTEVFTAFAAYYDPARATALTVPLLVLSMTIAAAAVLVAGDRLVTTRRGGGRVPAGFLGGCKPAFVATAAIAVLVALVVPVAALMREASGVRSWAEALAGSGAAIRNSLVIAGAGATITVVVGLGLAHGRARAGRAVASAADLAFVGLFAIPSTVVGIGLIGLWNRPGVAGVMYATDAMLLLVCLARFLPIAALGLAAAVGQVPLSHEEAAAAAGAGWTRTMLRVVIPQISPGLAAAWVVVFVLAFGELGASILVAPPGDATLPIRIYTLIANAPPSQVAALALLQSVVILAPLVALAGVMAARESR